MWFVGRLSYSCSTLVSCFLLFISCYCFYCFVVLELWDQEWQEWGLIRLHLLTPTWDDRRKSEACYLSCSYHSRFHILYSCVIDSCYPVVDPLESRAIQSWIRPSEYRRSTWRSFTRFVPLDHKTDLMACLLLLLVLWIESSGRRAIGSCYKYLVSTTG